MHECEILAYLTDRSCSIRTNNAATAVQASRANRILLFYLAKLVDKRSEKAQDDLISKLVVEQVKPNHLSREEAVQVAFLLLVAGNATMVNMISLGVVTLLQYPKQLAELKQDPSLAKGFVEELCRYHQGSAMATRRVAKEDVVYGGKVGRTPSNCSELRANEE
jgi:fungal nitric oxide reductase